MPPRPGRPFNKKLAEQVLAGVGDDLLSLTEAADRAGVPRRTLRSWIERDAVFAASFRAACEVRTEGLFEKLTRRASSATEVAAQAERDGLNPNAAVGALRVECDNLRWALSKLAPARYGDRTTIAGDAEAPLFVEQPDPGKLALGIMSMLAKAKQAEASIIDNEPELPAVSLSAGLGAPAPLFAAGSPDPLWQRDPPPPEPRAGTILGARRAEPFADAPQLVDSFAGASAQSPSRPTQTPAEIREAERVAADRGAGRTFDIATGRLVYFPRGGR